jgi:hypothetical protein
LNICWTFEWKKSASPVQPKLNCNFFKNILKLQKKFSTSIIDWDSFEIVSMKKVSKSSNSEMTRFTWKSVHHEGIECFIVDLFYLIKKTETYCQRPKQVLKDRNKSSKSSKRPTKDRKWVPNSVPSAKRAFIQLRKSNVSKR